MKCDTCTKCFIVTYLVAVIIILFEDTSYICNYSTVQFKLTHVCTHTFYVSISIQ